MPTLAEIKNLISAGKSAEALSALLDYCQRIDPKFENEQRLLKSRFSKIEKDSRKGRITQESESVGLVNLNEDILEFIDTLSKDPITDPGKWTKFIWSGKRFFLRHYALIEKASIVLLLLIVALLFSLKKYDLPAQFTIDANRIAFTQSSDGDLEINKTFENIELIQFQNISIPAKAAKIIDRDTDEEKYSDEVSGGIILIKAIANLEPSILFSDVNLESLHLKAGTETAFTMSDTSDAEDNILEIDVTPGDILGNIIFQDSLYFDCSDSYIKNLNSELDDKRYSWAEGYGFIQNGTAEKAKFSGNKSGFKLLLELGSDINYSIDDPKFDIDNIKFIRPAGPGYSKSSIITGRIDFLDKKGTSFNSVELNRSDIIRIKNNDKLDVTHFAISKNKISIKFVGHVDEIYYGPSREKMQLINPSWMTWIWNSFGIVIGLPAILLLILGFVPRLFTKRKRPSKM